MDAASDPNTSTCSSDFSVPEPLDGPLFHFNLTGNRRAIAVDDPRLRDRVADNVTFHALTESESLLIGRDFRVITDIETAPSGKLYSSRSIKEQSMRSPGADRRTGRLWCRSAWV